ncbi:hypothetical protein CXG81DRAFT_19827 [Caulochytrium protostelioides]|uniref:Uncharacterized protein n=1 Tax=Caulochytrium protostelioides TaxID=1555241 RepID=A0A4P9X548_9FUNG|nr:hypothetical protein CXG81DRAFT_19827 [Caulochytrium protostelioides]|eukprot:RKP00202.1 hypothetical protein CXG81DRAFT_19827 [Caulochytrium protostelioides]
MHYGVADNWAYYVTTSSNWAMKGSLELLEVSVGEYSPSLRTNTLERLAENIDYVQDNAPNAWTITQISFNISSCVVDDYHYDDDDDDDDDDHDEGFHHDY